MHWGSQGDASWITHSASVRGMYHGNNKIQCPALAPLPWNTPLPTLSENKSKTSLQKRCLQKASHGHTNEYKKGRPWRLVLVLNVPYQNRDTGKGGEEKKTQKTIQEHKRQVYRQGQYASFTYLIG